MTTLKPAAIGIAVLTVVVLLIIYAVRRARAVRLGHAGTPATPAVLQAVAGLRARLGELRDECQKAQTAAATADTSASDPIARAFRQMSDTLGGVITRYIDVAGRAEPTHENCRALYLGFRDDSGLLSNAAAGFTALADALGRGCTNNITLEGDASAPPHASFADAAESIAAHVAAVDQAVHELRHALVWG